MHFGTEIRLFGARSRRLPPSFELVSYLGSIVDCMSFCVYPSRDHARPYTALCPVAQEDCRGLCRGSIQHAHFWLPREYPVDLLSYTWLLALTIHARGQWGSFWIRYEYMICPVKDLSANAWHPPTCKPNDVFVWRHYELMQPAAAVVSFLVRRRPLAAGLVTQMPTTTVVQEDCRVDPLGTLSVPRARHGVLRESGRSVWRVLRIWIQASIQRQGLWTEYPGPRRHDRSNGLPVRRVSHPPGRRRPARGLRHVTRDSSSLRFLMGMFSYVYYSNLIRVHAVTVGSVLQMIANGLSVEDQQQLLEDLTRLVGGGR